MAQKLDLTGRRFGRLVAQRSGHSANGRVAWLCKCDCGNECSPHSTSLVSGNSKSCGCLNKEHLLTAVTKHGRAKTAEYRAWLAAKARCYRPGATRFSKYGARGIGMCARWKNDFPAFLADMGPRPSPAHSLDRIDVNGEYSPDNCRWATIDIQTRNRTSNVWVVLDGEKMTASDAAARVGISKSTLCRRLKAGWPQDLALKPGPQSFHR